jgi:hypothetical protein
MLLWPLIGILVLYRKQLGRNVVVTSENTKWYKASIEKELLCKWILGYFLFQCYFSLFAYLSGTKLGDFDPSGHLTCSLLACNLWLSILHFGFSAQDSFYEPNDHFLRNLTYAIFIIVLYHLYVIFYTVSVYHDTLENLVGLFFGMILEFVVFEVSSFSEAIYYLAFTRKTDREVSLMRAQDDAEKRDR